MRRPTSHRRSGSTFLLVLGVAMLVPLHELGRRFGGARTGLWAAALGAIYPNWVAFSHSLWSETLYTLLALSGLAAVAAYADRRGLPKLVAGGLAFGVGSLVRVVGLAFPVIASAWLVWIMRRDVGNSTNRGTF